MIRRWFRRRVAKKRVDQIFSQWLEWRANVIEQHPFNPMEHGVFVTYGDFSQMVDAVGEFLQAEGKF